MTSNIVLHEYLACGQPNYDIVRRFLYMVDSNMMSALERSQFSSKKCTVLYQENFPMCTKHEDGHIIFLCVKDNYWCQWVYQFAHEYCHHLIDGELSGGWSDMLWFEETLCELSSIYNLNKMIEFCEDGDLQYYAPSVESYLNGVMTEHTDEFNLSSNKDWYKQYETSLKEKGYKRELYNAIAVLMFPLFNENPHLWKLILHIGDIRSWNSLPDLFSHLENTADDSYRDSFHRLQRIFY